MRRNISLKAVVVSLTAALALGGAPLHAQVKAVDPDTAIDGDLSSPGTAQAAPAAAPAAAAPSMDIHPGQAPSDANGAVGNGTPVEQGVPVAPDSSAPAAATGGTATTATADTTYHKDDLIGAAEGVFGKGAAGLAGLIEDLLKKQGEPDAYITGREAGGAFIFGLRYGSGTLHHKVEGDMPVYWTGPSIGLDAGANAAKTFVLVYNLYDSHDLYHRFGAGEGQAYLVGGFNVSYLRRGDVVLIPVRMGAGLRLGLNGGYMKFSDKQNWMPF